MASCVVLHISLKLFPKTGDLLFFFKFIYFSVCMCECGEGTKGEGENLKQDSPLSAEPDAGLNLTTLRSWPDLSQNQELDTQPTEPLRHS